MKYFLRVLFVIVMSVCVITAMYYYTTGKSIYSDGAGSVSLTTVSKQPATEKNSGRVLLASLEKEDYFLYKSSRSVVISHNDKEYEYTNWNIQSDIEAPTLYCSDIDDDNEKELIVRTVLNAMQQSDGYTYCLYILDPIKDDNGNDNFNVILADDNDWNNILLNQIKIDISQLKSCKKCIQFVMDTKTKPIRYDKTTGLALSGHASYVRALSNGGDYMTVDRISKTNGTYSVDKNGKINVSVDIVANYKDSPKTQLIGNLSFALNLKASDLVLTKKTMLFTPNKEYYISDPTVTSSTPWSYTENNSDKSAPVDNGVIDWLKIDTSFDPTIATQTVTYENNNTDINHIASVTVSDSYIQLVAKSGCTFDSNVIKNGEYSVTINTDTAKQLDIAYTAKADGNILIISLDKSYPQKDIKKLSVNFGAK